MLDVVVRRTISLLTRVGSSVRTVTKVAGIRLAYSDADIPFDVLLGSGVVITATDGGAIKMGRNVSVGAGAQLVARGGLITIGDNVHIGTGVVVVSIDGISIGHDTLIAEYVVIRDQDHALGSSPIRSGGFDSAKISIGSDCWLGAKATILRGSAVLDGAVIGAHSVVRGNIPADTIAVGAPARVAKMRPVK